jgi:hypothetical protein
MKTKILLLVFAALLIASISGVYADECAESGTNLMITYSPSDLYVANEFNLTYHDLFAGTGQQVTLNFPSTLSLVSGTATVMLTYDGVSGSEHTWRMNSSAPGNHIVYVTAHYASDCNVTREIVVLGPNETPVLALNYIIPMGDVIAKQTKLAQLVITNTGNATAYNVTGWTDLSKTIDTFTYSDIAKGSSATRNFSINTANCSDIDLISTANYQNIYGYRYLPSHVNSIIHVVGSDVAIDEFESSKDTVERGKTVEFTVKVRNTARTNTISASNTVVKIYRGSTLLKEIDLGSITPGDSKTDSVSWKASGTTGEATIKAVVDSDNECDNYNSNDEETLKLTIRKEAASSSDNGGNGNGGVTGTGTGTSQTQQQPQQPAQQTTTQTSEETGIEMPIAAIILELIALAFIVIIICKRPKRYPKVPPISKNF